MTTRPARPVSTIFVTDELQRGGGGIRTHIELAESLAASGADVSLAFLRTGRFLATWRSFAARVVPIPYRRPSPRAGPRMLALWLRNALGGLLAAVRIGVPRSREVVLCNGHDEVFSAAVVAMFRGSPLVVTLCSPTSWRGHVDDFPPWLRFGYRATTRFLSVADHLADDWAAHGLDRERIDVVHTGIDVNRWRPEPTARAALRAELGISEDAFVVLYGGRFAKDKGLHVLAEAFARIDGGTCDAHLVAVGAGEDSGSDAGPAYIEGIRALVRPDALHILDAVPDLTPWYSMADVVVVPSLVVESFSRVILEAMACKCPVVASDIGGSREVLTGEFTALRYPPDDVGALADRLNAVRNWSADDPSLGQRCRDRIARDFTIDVATRATIASMETALADRKRVRTALRAMKEWRRSSRPR